ncbi:fungal-specific transcription factor [Apiospora rasikravindrae]|uniref:Fungal-specific transcription factor n=1 Tax=Apiospora rasikravindrae TaxID=990691 RepID=A0ABR1U7G1_9PEZI
MVKFVDSDPSGLPLKRKQVAQACVACRRRKKRCTHEPGEEEVKTVPLHSATSSPSVPSEAAAAASATAATTGVSSGRSSLPSPPDLERRPSRFVGDLNPEHFLIEATSPHSSRDLSVRGGVGVWHAKQPVHQEEARQCSAFSSSSSPSVTSALRSGPGRLLHDLVVAHVRTHCLTCVPPEPDWTVLKRIYLQRLDPLFPAISSLLSDNSPPSDPATVILVRQVASLAAAADPEARDHLRLKPNGPLLSPQDFRANLTSAVHATLDCSGLVTDRMLLVRLLLVLSMYVQPCSPDEADLPALLFARASHHLQTLGHHIGGPDEAADPEGYAEVRTVYCCVWALDRLTAAFYGRACILHERDIGWDMDKVIETASESSPQRRQQLPPAFRVFLGIARLLDQVIDIYRPIKKPDVEDEEQPVMVDLPILEQMIVDADATEVPSGLLATLEVFYHSVAILSCKLPADGNGLFPHSLINGRRSHSADRITEIVGSYSELLRHGPQDPQQQPQQQPPAALKLSCTPLLPYAVSLALGVAYLKMRHSQVPLFRARGRRAFVAAAALLRDDPRLGGGGTSWTARTMAGMAEQVLQEMDKASATATTTTTNSATVPADNSAADAIGDENNRTDDQGANVVVNNKNLTTGPTAAAAAATTTTTAPAAPSAGLLYDDNVFEHLDPAFDLDAVDAAIEGSLDFGASSNWFDWQQHNWSFTMPQQ